MAENNQISKETARSILQALLSPDDLKKLEFIQAVMLSGLPGSGKTTVARLLETGYGFERFSSDKIRMEEMFTDQAHRNASEHEKVMASRYQVYEELGRRVKRRLSLGHRVVVDGTNLEAKRMGVLGNIVSEIPVERMAFIVIKPPEWIMRKRFKDESEQAYKDWWSVYKYWRTYMREGKAAYPTETHFPRMQIIPVRRYALRTFEWVPDVKAILWDVDGTLYESKELSVSWNNKHIAAYAKAKELANKKAENQFWAAYEKLGSRTKVLESVGIDGQQHMEQLSLETDYSKAVKSKRRLKLLFTELDHVKHFIFTNSSPKATEYKLEQMGLSEDLFERIFTTYELGFSTKNEEVYEQVLKSIRFNPEHVLVVGDREEHDVLPPKRMGMHTCYVWGVSREADVSLPSVYEVSELFGIEV